MSNVFGDLSRSKVVDSNLIDFQYDNAPSGNLRIITNSPPLKGNEGHLKVNEDYCCGRTGECYGKKIQ